MTRSKGFNYFKDGKAIASMIAIVVLLILFTIAAPEYWYLDVLAFVGYVLLFYLMRKNE